MAESNTNAGLSPETRELLENAYGYILETALIDEIAKVSSVTKVRQGQILIDIGDYVVSMPLLLEGALKILREDKDGNELLLYYLEMGDTCAMSFSCCMSTKKSKVRAVAEEDCELLMVPVEYMEKWLGKYPSWKSFVFQSFETRMNEFLESLESIAFMKMDERLMKYLRDKAMVTGSTTLHSTHQEIAQDLHTSRVVVSRLLKTLENDGILKISRNKIDLLQL